MQQSDETAKMIRARTYPRRSVYFSTVQFIAGGIHRLSKQVIRGTFFSLDLINVRLPDAKIGRNARLPFVRDVPVREPPLPAAAARP